MPLRDHFHPPLRNRRHWEGTHSLWASTIVQHLSRRLPRRYFAEPTTSLGTQVEVDVVTFEQEPGSLGAEGAGATAVWAPPRPAQTVAVNFTAQDVFEVLVHDEQRAARVVAAVELVSPGNKDRPENRRAFVIKCAAYLQQSVALVVVDVVTERHANLHSELMPLLGLSEPAPWPEGTHLYAVAYHPKKVGERWQMDLWPEGLVVGTALPTLPLWLASDLAVPLELEASYEETCRVLRIS